MVLQVSRGGVNAVLDGRLELGVGCGVGRGVKEGPGARGSFHVPTTCWQGDMA